MDPDLTFFKKEDDSGTAKLEISLLLCLLNPKTRFECLKDTPHIHCADFHIEDLPEMVTLDSGEAPLVLDIESWNPPQGDGIHRMVNSCHLSGGTGNPGIDKMKPMVVQRAEPEDKRSSSRIGVGQFFVRDKFTEGIGKSLDLKEGLDIEVLEGQEP